MAKKQPKRNEWWNWTEKTNAVQSRKMFPPKRCAKSRNIDMGAKLYNQDRDDLRASGGELSKTKLG